MVDLRAETVRLMQEWRADFKFYDTSVNGYVGIIVDTKAPNYAENARKITSAGYISLMISETESLTEEDIKMVKNIQKYKEAECEVFLIPERKLEMLHESLKEPL